MVTLLIVWGALPFVAITLYAGLAQVPRELVEAAEIDGAGPWRVFRDVTFPILKPILLILTSLSIIWDFGVFTQPYLLIGASHDRPVELPDGHLRLRRGLPQARLRPRRRDLAPDAADRRGAERLLRPQDGADEDVGMSAQREHAPPSRRGRARRRRLERRRRSRVFVVMVFPVFWMVSTAFKPDDEINGADADVVPAAPDARRTSRDAIDRPYFWDDVKNSLIIVGVDGRRSRWCSRSSPRSRSRSTASPAASSSSCSMIGIQMLPQAGLIIPLYVVLARYHQVNALTGVIVTYMTFVLPFAVWTLRGFILGIPKELEEAAMVDGSSRLGAFVRILLPLVAPGLVATSVFAFITTWNEYIFARVLLNDQSKQTVTVWLSYFLGTSRNTDWGALMAASTLTAIPVVVFFLLVQRKIAFGLDRRRRQGVSRLALAARAGGSRARRSAEAADSRRAGAPSLGVRVMSPAARAGARAGSFVLGPTARIVVRSAAPRRSGSRELLAAQPPPGDRVPAARVGRPPGGAGDVDRSRSSPATARSATRATGSTSTPARRHRHRRAAPAGLFCGVADAAPAAARRDREPTAVQPGPWRVARRHASTTGRASPGAARCSTSRGTSSPSTRSSGTSTCSRSTSSTACTCTSPTTRAGGSRSRSWPRLADVRRRAPQVGGGPGGYYTQAQYADDRRATPPTASSRSCPRSTCPGTPTPRSRRTPS